MHYAMSPDSSTPQSNDLFFKKIEVEQREEIYKVSTKTVRTPTQVCTIMPTTTELEACEVYIKKLLAGVDDLATLQLDLKPDMAVIVDTLMERVLTLVDSATDLNNLGHISSEKLRGMYQEVTTVCKLLRHKPLDTSTAPVLPIAPVLSIAPKLSISECTTNALPPSVPDPFQPIIKAAMIVEGRYICEFKIDTDA